MAGALFMDRQIIAEEHAHATPLLYSNLRNPGNWMIPMGWGCVGARLICLAQMVGMVNGFPNQ